MDEIEEQDWQQLPDGVEKMRQRLLVAEQKLAELESGTVSQSAHWIHQFGENIKTIQASQSLEDVWRSVSHALQEMLGCTRTAVYCKNKTTELIVCSYANGLTRKLRDAIQETVSAFFALETPPSQPVVVNSVDENKNNPSLFAALQEELVTGYVLFFFSTPENLWGVAAAFRDSAQPFSAEEISLGLTVVQIGTTAIKNQQLINEANITLQREQKRNEITRTLSSALDLPSVLQNVSRIATELIAADAGLLGLVIDNQIMIFYPHNIPMQMNLRPAARGRGVAWKIVEDGQSILLDDYYSHPLAQPKWASLGIKAFIGVPVSSNDECLGALTVFNISDRPFTRRDLALVESVAQQAGSAIQNARMFAEAEQRASALANALNRQDELDKLKNQFIQTVSHELRSPLGIIYGHAELLESGDLGELNPIQQNSIEIISGRVRMLTDLMDDLTALMAAETQEFRRDFINPGQFLYAMVAEYGMQAENHNITLVSEIAEDALWVQGDLTQLRRVFDNLLSNAFKYTDAGGTILLRLMMDVPKVVFEVADSGEGISPKHLPRIFERFYQVTDNKYRPRRKGTGLGLSLVKEIIEAHRGQVSVASELGVGTTFRIELPGYEPPQGEGVKG